MTFFQNSPKHRFGCGIAAAAFTCASVLGATAVHADSKQRPLDPAPETTQTTEIAEPILLKGTTKASYYWDDASGRMGDTGLPASGKPMQKGLFASPSWPLLTEGYVIYKGKKAPFFIGDRGPGIPSNNGVMLDMDGKTFAELVGGSFNMSTLTVAGFGPGHVEVEYVVTKWGPGVGKKDHPVPFSSGAWSVRDNDPATPPAAPATPVAATVE
ncbi:hypothetical protein [Sphaerisporangium sp. TRM90804]|uniref:hypothetical protein n=1 Tax=Sphaerisporangium sp. TRM90804 TaxID=3031113 RepID=UPI00326793E3